MSEGKFKSGTGDFTLYHTNGQKKTEGQFEKGQPAGKWKHFNTDGELNRESEILSGRIDMYQYLVGNESNRNEMAFGNFSQSFPFGSEEFSFSFGDGDSTFAQMQQQMNQSMEQLMAQMDQMMKNFSDTSFTRSFQFDTTFSFNGFDNGNGFFSFKSFGDSSFSKSFHFDTIFGEMPQRSNPFFNSRGSDLVDFPDTEPSFVGGEDAMNAFIEQEMQPILETSEESTDGTVFIEAIVETDGSISNSRVALGMDSAHDDEALRITRQMPLWKPATVDELPVRSRCIIPIRFSRN